jgi:hypothetical protein
MDWLRQLADSHEAMGALLPYVLRLASLLPRIFGIARDAVGDPAGEAAQAAVEHLQPLTDALLNEASALVGRAISQDALVLEALEGFSSALEKALGDPRVAAMLTRGLDATLAGVDRLIEGLVERALSGAEDNRFVGTALVLESLIRSSLERALNVSAEERHGRSSEL